MIAKVLPFCLFESITDNFNFGKYKNLSLADVLDINPSYVEWCVKKCHGVDFLINDDAITQIKIVFPEFPITSYFEALCRNRFENLNRGIEYAIYDEECFDNEETPTYGRYSDSYAQTEMGYSDDDIDTIFDGDPMAYWNID